MRNPRLACTVGAVVAATLPWTAHAISFEGESVSGDFTSTVSTGIGLRTRNPSANFVARGNQGGDVSGLLDPLAGYGDQGDLSYGRGDLFTAYVKGTHELVLKFPEQYTVMARGSWLRDFAATETTGDLATASQGNNGVGGDGLTDSARKDLRFKARLLDLWVSKSFDLGDQRARLRVGNQVISWGESLFTAGGINQTNAVDIMRLSQPGTQMKEALLPAPMASFATGLGHGLNLETYVQARWNASYFPPVGSYWSTTYALGNGHDDYASDVTTPKKTGQWGVSLRWQPSDMAASFGLYAMNYTDKTPNLSLANIANTGRIEWDYLTNRKLYGISANLPVGDWAVGTELSYRPKDAVSLNSYNGCTSQAGQCWTDRERLQWHLAGTLSLTPSNARDMLDLLGADSATFLGELVVINYPGLKKQYGGDLVSAGGWAWGNEYDYSNASLSRPVGTATSSGVSMDFSVTYDGSVIPGWQVVPELFYSVALQGRTPSLMGTFMQGAQSANLMVSFLQNPLKWQFGVNYAKFWGGSNVFDQPFRDRDYVGAFASYNF